LKNEPQTPRIRVGFDARWYNDSGVGAYVFGLLSALARSHDEIDLVIYEDAVNPVPLPHGARAQRIPVKAGKYSASEQIELARRCRRDKLDVFHSPFYVVPLFAPCPVVVTVHDLIPFLFPIYAWPKSAIVRGGYRLAALKAKHVIADSNKTEEDVRRILGVKPSRISAIHIAAQECYTAKTQPGELELLSEKYGVRPPYIIVSSARNWRTKNLETALQALEAARQQSGFEFETVVYGSPEGLRATGGEERWRTLNLKCTGYVESADLAMLFRHAIVFVMASLYEGFGLPLLEAMACGCAVVCSNGGALAEVAGNGAQVFNPFDAPGMAAAVCALLREEADLQRWRDAALSRSREFSWLKAARESISVYHQARNGSSPQRQGLKK
jgi:glycosyltransferase involved in cell wall biosynthesis